MSGATAFYNITQIIKDELLNDVNINTVSTGDITDVNLYKFEIFPIGHIIINSVEQAEQTLTFSLSILVADVVDKSKELTVDRFKGNDNVQDILNTQLTVLNTLIQRLRKGTLYDDKYQLLGNPQLSPFYERFENQLAGWTADVSIQIHNDINIC